MKTTILVVDDESDLRNALVIDFKKKNFEVTSAANGQEAFQAVCSNAIDLVVTDIRMPNRDGVELLYQIKSSNRKKLPVILITGFSDITAEEAYSLGAAGLISKPFNRKTLHDVVKTVLTPKRERWALRDEAAASSPFKIHKALQFGDLKFGSGGFFVPWESGFPKTDEGIHFHLELSGSNQALIGTGCVRWVRYRPDGDLPSGIGIEIRSLERELRERIIELTEAVNGPEFIPRS